jgi:hypothetical protein
LNKELKDDELLDFLMHLESCPRCLNAIYAFRRAHDERLFEAPNPAEEEAEFRVS